VIIYLEPVRKLPENIQIKIYRSIILLLVLYGCDNWTLTSSEKHGRRVFENMILRKIFGPKRDEVRGHWRKLHAEELHNFYSVPNIIRMMEYGR
jgi:hypothetical protein